MSDTSGSGATRELVERDRPRHRDVQRLRVAALRDRRPLVAAREHLGGQAVALGARESDEFERQSTDLAATWRADPPLVVPDRNHFDIVDGLIEGDVLQLALKLAK